MASSSVEIKGMDNVERHISAMLGQAEKRLRAACNEFGPEMLFAVLEGANYICLELTKPKDDGFTLTVPILEALRWFTMALDPLLRASGGIIRAPSVESLRSLSKRFIVITAAMDDLQYWKRVQEAYQLDPMQSAITKGDRLVDPEQVEFYSACVDLMPKLGPDTTWRKHFSERILNPNWEKIRPLYNKAFQQYYRMQASDFAALEAYFKGVARSQSQKAAASQMKPLESNRPGMNYSPGFPQAMNIVSGIFQGSMPVEDSARFTPVAMREQVLADLQNEMHFTKEQARMLLATFEYKPGADIFRHPLVPLLNGRRRTYALLPWAFYPLSICGEEWDGRLFLFQKQKSEWAKTIGEWYGNGFRDYVVSTLEKAVMKSVSIEQEVPAEGTREEVRDWLDQLPRKNGKLRQSFPPLDIVAQGDDIALLISCKAEDLYFDCRLWANYLWVPAKVIRDTAKRNREYLIEIGVEAYYVASVGSLRRQLGLLDKRILPVLVTSRKEPLGSDRLRTYLSKTLDIPNVPVLTADELRDFVASGLNTDSLHLSFLPMVF